ncbi:unnamed protein product [Peronospora belbahrii]|uniref:SAM-dependent MTase RsmB/NOP-type domain-containing protein n=1 Tax=Peronospora belbahrii TaxID=622444 RepID=A0AAU9KYA0_9STRA|nr:unnamed protein product [Peronospora belbahrii]
MSELYKEAATLLYKLEQRQAGLKTMAYAESTVHKRSSFALVCETLRYKPLLRELLMAVPECHKALKMSKDVKKPPPALVFVALYDLLFGRQKIQGGGYVKKTFMQYQTAFRAALARLKIKRKVASNEALLPLENRKKQHLAMPRYVRFNTLLASMEEIEAFMREYDAKQDQDVRDLLVLPSGTELHEHGMVTNGKLVLQDKASCFPAFVLHGEYADATDKQGDVIDACAAPGNKTSHLAMLLQQQDGNEEDGATRKRRVFAFDRSPKRLALLKRRIQLAGAAALVHAELQSFLEVCVDDEKYRNVRSILLDPSCSGSGMTNRLDHLLDIASARDTVLEPNDGAEYEQETAKRLQALADFQLEALRGRGSCCGSIKIRGKHYCSASFCAETSSIVVATSRVGGESSAANERTSTAASVQDTATSPASSAKAKMLHTVKKRKVLSSVSQKDNRKRRKREKRKKHGNSVSEKTKSDEQENTDQMQNRDLSTKRPHVQRRHRINYSL